MEHDVLALLVEAHRLITDAWDDTRCGAVADFLAHASDELKQAMEAAMHSDEYGEG
jgi:hypothetical protein